MVLQAPESSRWHGHILSMHLTEVSSYDKLAADTSSNAPALK